ncbi:hypothetical protein [Endozoicomonas sp. 8E]|uniref:hypothetical protein n=1 Tax=Endozoicomonas sp. 8E TaxID=3035692 RepID=UPI002938DA78|nr:hypothetical protein [Endozoicomonas sp. 8E]WOG29250.1 hypothetical protein P6910_06195 [Endozoicomonas sp. 8E]
MKQDSRDRMLESIVRNKSFAEIGGLWGGEQERLSVAHEFGARELTMIDILPPVNQWWHVFEDRMKQKGIEGYQTLSGDIMTMPCGPYDITHSSGVMYHLPNPVQYLSALRAITNEYCVMTSASIPRRIENKYGLLELDGGKVLFVPGMSEEQKWIFTEFYVGDNESFTDDDGMFIGFRNMGQDGFATTNYVPWWWLLPGEAIVSMARAAGWEVVEISENWGGKAHTILLKNNGRVDTATMG